jgi:hypothetical protein
MTDPRTEDILRKMIVPPEDQSSSFDSIGYLTPDDLTRAMCIVEEAQERRFERMNICILANPAPNHQCTPLCVCPEHPHISLLYNSTHRVHACLLPDCRFAQGVSIELADNYKDHKPFDKMTEDEYAAEMDKPRGESHSSKSNDEFYIDDVPTVDPPKG